MQFYSVSRYLLAGLTGLVLSACALPRTFTPVQIEGVQHLGPDYNIALFYIDGASGSNIGREGSGGGVCCVNLPDKWYPGMKSVVRWTVGDWSQENRAEIEKDNYRSVKSGGTFKATVPVEKYEQTGHIYAHFFPGGKVRLVVGSVGATNQNHPIPYGPHDDATATVGVEVETLFTKEELKQRADEDRAYKRKHGDWR